MVRKNKNFILSTVCSRYFFNLRFDGESGSDVEMTAATQLRGDVSPLTPPPRKAPNNIDIELPPPPPPPGDSSPRTPPLPPPPQRALQEGVMAASFDNDSNDDDDENMSPVSDTELGDLSPPNESPETPDESSLPSPPPLQQQPPPPSDDVAHPPPLPPSPPPLPPPAESVMTPPPPPQVKPQIDSLTKVILFL